VNQSEWRDNRPSDAPGDPPVPSPSPWNYDAPSTWAASTPPPTPKDTDGFSVAALVLGILGVVIAAVPLGVIGLTRTKGGVRKGRGMAIAGLVLSGAWFVVIMIVAAGALLLTSEESTVATGASPASSPGRGHVTFDKLRTGDCIDPAPPESVLSETVPVVSCTLPHDEEAFATPDAGEGDWPGDAAIDDRSDKVCTSQFEAFVGIPIDRSRFDLLWYSPDKQSWQDGDHSVVCVISDPRGKTIGTLRDTRR
jgi:putative regulator of septum formation